MRPHSVALIEVCACAILLRGAVEIVEHEVHVRLLLPLKVVDDSFIPVDLDLYIGIILPR